LEWNLDSLIPLSNQNGIKNIFCYRGFFRKEQISTGFADSDWSEKMTFYAAEMQNLTTWPWINSATLLAK
jgi:hypothetical protein